MRRFCVVCNSSDASPWTLLHGPETYVVTLCEEHAEPVRKLIELAEIQPRMAENPRVVQSKRPPLKPLDWTPPN